MIVVADVQTIRERRHLNLAKPTTYPTITSTRSSNSFARTSADMLVPDTPSMHIYLECLATSVRGVAPGADEKGNMIVLGRISVVEGDLPVR